MAVLAAIAGEYDITATQVFQIILFKLSGLSMPGAELPSKTSEVIVWGLRMPRLLVVILSGIALAASGTAYQGCFRNPLVEPFILGVSSGAACGAALAIVFPLFFPSSQITAFTFALGAVLLACTLAKNKGETPPVALVLAGIIIASLFSSAVGILKYVASDAELRDITFWMMGGFYYSSWQDVALMAATILPCFALLCAMGWKLNLLSLGDEEARSLGIHPSGTRFVIILLATLCAATCVATVGIIAWVGLMMPHAARMLFGPDNRLTLPLSALLGAIYLLLCDTIARTLTGTEIPIGIVASLLGGPYLLWLLRGKGRSLYA